MGFNETDVACFRTFLQNIGLEVRLGEGSFKTCFKHVAHAPKNIWKHHPWAQVLIIFETFFITWVIFLDNFWNVFYDLGDFRTILEMIFCLDALMGPRRLQRSILVAKNVKKTAIWEAQIEIFGIILKCFFA